MEKKYEPRQIDQYLSAMIQNQSSDMYLTVDCPPIIRKGSTLSTINNEPLTVSKIEVFINEMLSEDQRKEFENTLEMNSSISLENTHRFRVNICKQRYKPAIVLRRIESQIPSLEQLGLPKAYKEAVMKRSGLILLSSGTGSGKSSSMAAMIDYRNKNTSGHILTVEDPIEFIHPHQGCIITQREIGTDTISYHEALKSALRQRADVVVVGEIRDRETMEYALRFAETGHLCLSTLHSTNSSLAFQRITNFFPDEMHRHILSILSQNLVAIFSQRIIPSVTPNKTELAIEILLNQGVIKTLIEQGRILEIPDNLARLKASGMQTMDQAILDLLYKGKISTETAETMADSPSNIKFEIEKIAHTRLSTDFKLSSRGTTPPPHDAAH